MNIIEARQDRIDKKVKKEKSTNMFKVIMNGTFFSIVTTLIMLVIFSVILTYSNVGEETIDTVTIVVTGISIFIGSSIATSSVSKNGILNGGIIGLIYIISIYLISSSINGNFELQFESFLMMIIGTVFGVIGGIIGVNKK